MMGITVSTAGSCTARLLRQQQQCTGAGRVLSGAHAAQRWQQRQTRVQQQQCAVLTSASGAIPESPPEWTPPSQTPDSMPGSMPEFVPPDRPEITPGQGSPAEYQPPGRIAPPERPAEPQPGTTEPDTRPAPPEIPGRPAQPDNPPDTPYRPDEPVPESDPGAQPDKGK